MDPNENNNRSYQDDVLMTRGPLGYVAAAMLAVPVGAVVWFELVYLWFGLTGEDPPAAVNAATAILAFGAAFGWPLYGAVRSAEVVRRSCHLGVLAALLLPVVAIAVLLLWENASGRRDLGMGGLILYNMPLVAFGVAAVLGIAFGLGGRLAARRLQSSSPMADP